MGSVKQRVLVGPAEVSTARNVLIGGTALLAIFDGGLGNLLVCSAAGAGSFAAHQAMINGDLEKDRQAIIAEVESDDAKDPKDRKHSPKTKEELRAIARSLHGDQNIAYCTSVGMGILTFLNPVVGLGLIGCLFLGRFRHRDNF